jgi:hypothetical protein
MFVMVLTVLLLPVVIDTEVPITQTRSECEDCDIFKPNNLPVMLLLPQVLVAKFPTTTNHVRVMSLIQDLAHLHIMVFTLLHETL